jgi:Predicted branched-chain amino acid permease (azaleucine resistance)
MKVTPLDQGVSAARRAGIGVGLAVGCSGVAFGAAAVTAGLDVAQACVLSLFAFTGASQFALAGTVAGGGDLVAGTAGALLLGARNGLYGLRLAGPLGVRGLRRLGTAHGVIDETTAVAMAQLADARAERPGEHGDAARPEGGERDEAANRRARAGFFTTFVTLYLAWNVSTLIGAVGTAQVADPAVLGLDAVGPACFLALLWPRLRAAGAARLRAVAAGGAAIALVTTPLLPPGVPVLLASLAALPVLLASARPARAEAAG